MHGWVILDALYNRLCRELQGSSSRPPPTFASFQKLIFSKPSIFELQLRRLKFGQEIRSCYCVRATPATMKLLGRIGKIRTAISSRSSILTQQDIPLPDFLPAEDEYVNGQTGKQKETVEQQEVRPTAGIKAQNAREPSVLKSDAFFDTMNEHSANPAPLPVAGSRIPHGALAALAPPRKRVPFARTQNFPFANALAPPQPEPALLRTMAGENSFLPKTSAHVGQHSAFGTVKVSDRSPTMSSGPWSFNANSQRTSNSDSVTGQSASSWSDGLTSQATSDSDEPLRIRVGRMLAERR